MKENKEEEGMQSLNLKSKVDSSLSKINVMCSNEGLFSNKKQESFASLVGLGNLGLASESLLIEIF